MSYSGKNAIGSIGVSHLSKGDWPNLGVLKLSTIFHHAGWNNIGVDGLSFIAKGKWGKLKEVRLSIYDGIEIGTDSLLNKS
jgi:hypothetical protein